MASRTPKPSGLRDLVRHFSEGLAGDELKRLFDRDAPQAYEVLTRDQKEPEPKDGFHRLLHRARLLFLSISYKLTPARRLLFAAALLFLFFNALDFSLSAGDVDEHGWAISIDASPLWGTAAGLCLLLLLSLEMVDKVRVRDELEVARQLQTDLLPRASPELAGYRFAHSYRTANAVGGDYYDFLPLADGKLALVVGDASGHGMAAGLVMAIAHATLRTAIDVDPACDRVLAMVNRTICRTGDRRTFMSLFYGLLEPSTGAFEHCSAGHPFPLLRRASGEILELGTGGLPLGLKDPLPACVEQAALLPGDTLVLYSDGLPEAIDGEGNAFGFERLRELTAEGGSAQEIHDRIFAAFDRHTAASPLHDDLTLVVVHREAELPPLPAAGESEAAGGLRSAT